MFEEMPNVNGEERYLKGKGSVPLFTDALKIAYPTIRRNAARTLGHLGCLAVSALPALWEALQDADLSVRHAAEEAVLKILKDRSPAKVL